MADRMIDDLDVTPTEPAGPPSFLKVVALVFAVPGVLLVAAIIAIFVADIVARHALQSPIRSAVELVEFLAYAAAIFAIPAACAFGELSGGLPAMTAPRRNYPIVRALWAVVLIAGLLVVAFAAFLQALRLTQANELSMFLGWPIAAKPMAIAIACFLGACATLVAAIGAFRGDAERRQ